MRRCVCVGGGGALVQLEVRPLAEGYQGHVCGRAWESYTKRGLDVFHAGMPGVRPYERQACGFVLFHDWHVSGNLHAELGVWCSEKTGGVGHNHLCLLPMSGQTIGRWLYCYLCTCQKGVAICTSNSSTSITAPCHTPTHPHT